MTTSGSRRLLAIALVSVATAVSAGPVAAAPGDDPDAAGGIDQLLACRAGGDTTTVEFTTPPQAVAAADPVGDAVGPDGQTAALAPADADIVGWVRATTGALDDATFDRLFGDGGLLTDGAAGVMTPTYDIDVDAFRSGLAITGIALAGPRQAAGGDQDASGVVVLGFDSRYPSPPTGNFAGINKAWRLDTSPAGDHVAYVQFAGQGFQEYHSDMLVVDGCPPPLAGLVAPAEPTQAWVWFFTTVDGPDTEGLEAVRPEVFVQRGGNSASDSSPLTVLAGMAPGEFEVVDVPLAPSPTTTTTTAPPAASPPPTTAPATAGSTATTAAKDDRSLLGFVLIPVGLGIGAGGLILVRTSKQRRAATPHSALSYLGESPSSPVEADAAIAWSQLLELNAEAEEHVGAIATKAAEFLVSSLNDYAAVVGEFAHPYRRSVSGMAMLLEANNEMEQKVALAKIADLVAAVVNFAALIKNVGKLGLHGVRWLRGGEELAEATRALEVAARVGMTGEARAGAVGTFVGAAPPATFAEAPTWFKGNDEFFTLFSKLLQPADGRDRLFWQMSRMAEEVGIDLEFLCGRFGVQEVFHRLALAIARARGATLIPAADAVKLERLLVQARNAERGQPYTYRFDDLQWLFGKNNPEGRLELGSAVSELEVMGSLNGSDIGKVLSPDDLRLINGILDRPGLGEAVADASANIRIELPATGQFPRIFDLPGSPTATGSFPQVFDLPRIDLGTTGTFPHVFDLPRIDPGATGTFPHVFDLPRAAQPVQVFGGGWGGVYVPPTVGPGRLLGDVLDVVPSPGTSVPGTIQPGQALPWLDDAAGTRAFPDVLTDPARTATFGQVLTDPARTATFGQVLTDGARTVDFRDVLHLDPTDTVPPGSMSVDDAAAFASSVLDSGRSGVVSGPGLPMVVSSLPPRTPLLIATETDIVFTGSAGDAAEQLPNLLHTGTNALGVFGQAYQTLTNDQLATTLTMACALQGGGTGWPVWTGELRPAQVAMVPTGDIPPGATALYTESGVVFVDRTQPAVADADATVPAGNRAGAAAAQDRPLVAFPVSSLAPGQALFDPSWLEAQQAALGQQAGALAGVIDVRTLLDNILDPSVSRDFCLFGIDLDGGSRAAMMAWLTFDLAFSPFETTTRITYFFTTGPMLENYVTEYAPDYQLMKRLAMDAIRILEDLQSGLKTQAGLLQDARQEIADRVAAVEAFGDANPGWVDRNRAEFDAKLARDRATIGHLDQMLQSLGGLGDLLSKLIPWVRSISYSPDGSPFPAYLLAYPTSLLRLTSAMLMLGDSIGRVMLVAPPPAPAPTPPATR